MFLMCKITESKRQQNELNKQKITERELSNLNQKINKLLTKLEEHEQEPATNPDEECVICITAKATISTLPCNHCVICRRCFVKTIQNSVANKTLPLRCVICREKILRLKQSFITSDLTEQRPSKSNKRQIRAYQSTQKNQLNYQNTNKFSYYSKNSSNKKRLNDTSTTKSLKSTCKKKIENLEITINQQTNNDTIENKKIDDVEKDLGKNLNENLNENLNNDLLKEESIKKEFSTELGQNSAEINKGIKKLNKSNRQTFKTKLLNLFKITNDNKKDYSTKIKKSNWFINFRIKDLFKF